MIKSTEEQRVRILVHHAWDLRDDGIDDKAIIKHIIDMGVPPDIANIVPGLIDSEIPKLIHDNNRRKAVLQEIETAFRGLSGRCQKILLMKVTFQKRID